MAPPPDVLYNNALRDYNGGKNDLALQEFSDYIKFYPNTDLAGNCYFYLGEIQFKQGNYRAGGAELRSGSAELSQREQGCVSTAEEGIRLLELGKQDEGVTELRHLIQRYPHSPEALQARERLRKLGVTTTARPS